MKKLGEIIMRKVKMMNLMVMRSALDYPELGVTEILCSA